ncbi:MAG: Holliday junction resolvase Hjc [Candidatus Bathyarchaeia archaeon]
MKRGVAEERELVHRLDTLGFAVLRAPASGSRTKLDRPDLVAGGYGVHLALEVKTSSRPTLYISKITIDQLSRFAQRFGATPYLAVKFKHQHKGWVLIDPKKLARTKTGYKLTLKEALKVGLRLEAVASGKLTDYIPT